MDFWKNKSRRFLLLIDTYQQFLSSVLLTLIILIAAYFRFHTLESIPHFTFEDSGRDILVAKHITKGWSSIWVAPDASGARNFIPNTPVYYWILSVLYFVIPSPYWIYCFFSIIGVLLVFLTYKIGELCLNKWLGLIAAFCIAVSPYYISLRVVWQPNLIPFLIALCMYCIFIFIKNKNSAYLNYASIFFLIALYLHHSVSVLLPAVFFLTLYLSFFICKKKDISIFQPVLILILGQILFINLTFIRIGFSLSKNMHAFLANNDSHQIDFWEAAAERAVSIFHTNGIPIGIALSILILIFILATLAFFSFRSKDDHILKFRAQILLAVSISIFFTLFYKGEFQVHYLTPFYYIYCIDVIFIASLLKKYFKKELFYLLLISLSACFYFLNIKGRADIGWYYHPSFTDCKSIAAIILNDSFSREKTNITIEELKLLSEHNFSLYYNGGAGGIFYCLEKISNKKLAIIGNSEEYYNNLVVSENATEYVFCTVSDNQNDYCDEAIHNLHLVVTELNPTVVEGSKIRLFRKL